MSINDLPVLSALRTRMQWHQERQRVLAENVVQLRYAEFQAARPGRAEIHVDRRQRRRIDGIAGDDADQHRPDYRRLRRRRQASTQDRKVGFETRPAGNAVNLEDEMQKVAANQMDYAAVNLALQPQPASSEDRDRQGLDDQRSMAGDKRAAEIMADRR